MKRLGLLIFLSGCVTFAAKSAPYVIRWLQNPPEDEVAVYKIWSVKGNSTNLLVTVPHVTGVVSNQTPVIEMKGQQNIFITAVNPGGEGPKSTNFIFFAKPGAPGGIDKTP